MCVHINNIILNRIDTYSLILIISWRKDLTFWVNSFPYFQFYRLICLNFVVLFVLLELGRNDPSNFNIYNCDLFVICNFAIFLQLYANYVLWQNINMANIFLIYYKYILHISGFWCIYITKYYWWKEYEVVFAGGL